MHQANQVSLVFKKKTHLLASPGFPGGTSGKESICQCRKHKRHKFNRQVRKIPCEEEMAAHSIILAWRILWTEEPDWLRSTELQGDRQNWSDLARTCITFPFLCNLFLSPQSRRIWESTITFRRQCEHPSTWGFPGEGTISPPPAILPRTHYSWPTVGPKDSPAENRH